MLKNADFLKDFKPSRPGLFRSCVATGVGGGNTLCPPFKILVGLNFKPGIWYSGTLSCNKKNGTKKNSTW